MAKDKRELDERYVKGKSFEEKTGEIFQLMGFEVELDRQVATYQIDIFIKRKKDPLSDKHSYYACVCKNWIQKIGRDVVSKSIAVRDVVRNDLSDKKLGNDCEMIIVSSAGFNKEAKQAADRHGIILYTYDQLLSNDLPNLIHHQLVYAKVEPANEEIFLKLLSEGKILLIFDAFDEMATMSNADITLANFRQLNRSVTGDAKVILTSRTHYFRDKYDVDTILKEQGVKGLSQKATALYREIQDKPEYEIVYLKEFSPAQIRAYLNKAM